MKAVWHLRTAMMFAVMTGLLVVIGIAVGYYLGNMWAGMWVMLAISIAMNLFSLFGSKKMALAANKVHLVTEAEEPRLYGIVKNLAGKAGLPMPEVGISEVPMPNAFATGRSPKDAAVVATRPILNLLTDEELEGVMAHELSHVKNRDILVMSAASTLASLVAFVTRMGVYSALFSGNNRNGGGILIMILINLTVPLAASLVQLGVSRNREFLADESGGRLTGRPMALASALNKLETGCSAPSNNYSSDSYECIWISSPHGLKKLSGFANLFRTHPTTEARIEKLRELDRELNGTYRQY